MRKLAFFGLMSLGGLWASAAEAKGCVLPTAPDTGMPVRQSQIPGSASECGGGGTGPFCPPGDWSPDGVSCVQTQPGYYKPLNTKVTDAPLPAPPGSYVPGYRTVKPTLASPGHYVAGTAQTKQTAAAPGYYVPTAGATAPIIAPAGSYVATSGATAPTPAQPGYYVPTAGQTKPTPAAPGSYVDTAGATSAKLASAGYYVPTAGQSAPTPAPPGSYVATRGATAATLADPGYYVAGSAATGQTAAPPGSYVPTRGATAPIPAQPGYFAAGPAATGQTIAPPGTYVASAGASAPTPAPKGYYVPTSGATSPTITPRGTYTDSLGATAPKTVEAGFYVPFAGSNGLRFTCGFIGESYGGASACRQTNTTRAFDQQVGPEGEVSASALDFGALALTDQATMPLSIRNAAAHDVVGLHLTTLSLLSYSFEGDEGFSLAGFTPGMTLEQGEQSLFSLVFQPTTAGLHHGWLTFVTDQFAGFGKAGKVFRIELSGLGTVTPAGVVPEPASWLLFLTGFGLIGAVQRRQQRRTA